MESTREQLDYVTATYFGNLRGCARKIKSLASEQRDEQALKDIAALAAFMLENVTILQELVDGQRRH